jgi:hypothetical protein
MLVSAKTVAALAAAVVLKNSRRLRDFMSFLTSIYVNQDLSNRVGTADYKSD